MREVGLVGQNLQRVQRCDRYAAERGGRDQYSGQDAHQGHQDQRMPASTRP